MPTDDVATAVSRIEAAGSSAPDRAAVFASMLTDGPFLDRLAGLDNAERDAAFALIQGALKRAAKVDDLRTAVAEVLRDIVQALNVGADWGAEIACIEVGAQPMTFEEVSFGDGVPIAYIVNIPITVVAEEV